MKVRRMLRTVIKVKYFVLIVNYKEILVKVKKIDRHQHNIKHHNKILNNLNKKKIFFQEQV